MVDEPGRRPDAGGQPSYPGGDTSRQGSRETMAETATAAAESVRSAATEKVEQQKKAASQSIDAFAQAVRRASDELRNQDQTAAAQLIQQAAGGLESLSRTLSNQSLGDMVGTVRDFGRRNPMALAGGAALLGLALGRVARTAAEGSNMSGESTWESSEASTGAVAGSVAGRGGSGTAGEFPASRASASPASTSFQSGPGKSQTDSQSQFGSAGRTRPGQGSQSQEDAKRSGGSS